MENKSKVNVKDKSDIWANVMNWFSMWQKKDNEGKGKIKKLIKYWSRKKEWHVC